VFTITDVDSSTTSIISYGSRTQISGSCYFTNTILVTTPALPKKEIDLMVSFRPAMSIVAAEKIVITLPGFTNSDFTGINAILSPGEGGSSGALILESLSYNNALFDGFWTEGNYVDGEAGFTGSKIELTLKPSQHLTPGVLYTVTVGGYANKIGSQCSMHKNNQGITIETNAVLGAVVQTPFVRTVAIGNACKHLNYCNKNGTCDLCQEMCICFPGHGASSDIYENYVPRDCSARVCPKSFAWASLPTGPTSSHILTECSGAGR